MFYRLVPENGIKQGVVSTIMRHVQHIDQILESVHRPEKNNNYLSKVDPTILRSWQRCVQSYKLEPSASREARILTEGEIKDYRLPVEEFLHTAKAGLNELYKQVKPIDFVVLLTDKNGIAVDYIGNEKFDSDLKEYSLYLGADWSEQSVGTSGVGVCATDMIPVTAHHTDHFDLKSINLTCSAAPIFDPEGKPLAVLDVSSLSSPPNKESQFLMLELVKRHAQAIESANFIHHFQKNHWIIRFGPLQEYVNINAQNMIALNENGIITGMNTAARKYLSNISSWTDSNWDSAIGKRITSYFGCELDYIINQKAGSGRCIKSVNLRKTAQEVFFSTIAPLNYKLMYLPSGKTPTSRTAKKTVFSLDDLSASDPAMCKAIKLAKRLTNTNLSFLIQGETGSGKEVFANAIHLESDRSDMPFIAVNCAAIPESLIESELFGYKPGTFTGARNKGMRGLIQHSSGGTLFLDEIGDMPLHLQTRLLRVLSEHEVMPLGSDTAVPVDLNVIAATHQNIETMIDDGAFREDLYFRLAGVTIRLPPLRERQDKQHIIRNSLRLESEDQNAMISDEALTLLMAYHWPGNIRELRTTLRVAYAFSDQSTIVVDDLPDDFIYKLKNASVEIRKTETLVEETSVSNDIATPDPSFHPYYETLVSALRKNRWNITDAANDLGISRATMYRKMKKYKVVSPNDMGI